MRYFKNAILYVAIGVGIGSFISLLSVTLHQATLSMAQLGLLMTMSVIMGLLSMIFEYDKLPFTAQFVSHFVLELSTHSVFIWLTFGDGVIILGNVPTFLISYTIVFICFRQQGRANAKRINEKLLNKRRE